MFTCKIQWNNVKVSATLSKFHVSWLIYNQLSRYLEHIHVNTNWAKKYFWSTGLFLKLLWKMFHVVRHHMFSFQDLFHHDLAFLLVSEHETFVGHAKKNIFMQILVKIWIAGMTERHYRKNTRILNNYLCHIPSFSFYFLTISTLMTIYN